MYLLGRDGPAPGDYSPAISNDLRVKYVSFSLNVK